MIIINYNTHTQYCNKMKAVTCTLIITCLSSNLTGFPEFQDGVGRRHLEKLRHLFEQNFKKGSATRGRQGANIYNQQLFINN